MVSKQFAETDRYGAGVEKAGVRAGAERNRFAAESMMRRIGYITGPVLHGYGGRCRKLTISDEIATEWNELLSAIEAANAEGLQKASTLPTPEPPHD